MHPELDIRQLAIHSIPVAFSAVLAMSASTATASDACSRVAVRTAADVSVSDGSSFMTESFFHTRDGAAIRHVTDTEQLVVAEGPLAWTERGGEAELSPAALGRFALGHQFHAMLLYFDEIVDGEPERTEVQFDGAARQALAGAHPYGGTAALVNGDSPERPLGMLVEDPDFGRIAVHYGDWRAGGGADLPYLVRIDDGERVFDYQFTAIDVAADSPLWFFDAIPAPAIDEVQVYRLHRRLLAAHCLGDADLLAELSAPDTVLASRGELLDVTREATRAQFTRVFGRWDYTGYVDLKPPVIRLAKSGDLGWIGVNVRATGKAIGSDESFDDQWAWFMTVGKFDGRWLTTGNASNRVE